MAKLQIIQGKKGSWDYIEGIRKGDWNCFIRGGDLQDIVCRNEKTSPTSVIMLKNDRIFLGIKKTNKTIKIH